MRKRLKAGAAPIFAGVIIGGGMIAGALLFTFLRALEFVNTFTAARYIPMVLFLPLIGAVTAYVYTKYGGGSERGAALLDDSVRNDTVVPARMSVLTYVFTCLSHLFGASVGKEGAGIQISGALFYNIGKLVKLPKPALRYVVMAGMSAGFTGVFGTPLTGAIFSMEICRRSGSFPEHGYFDDTVKTGGKLYSPHSRRRIFPWQELLPNLAAAYAAEFIMETLGNVRTVNRVVPPEVTPTVIAGVVAAAFLAGLLPYAYNAVRDTVKKLGQRFIKRPVLRGFVLTAAVGSAAALLGWRHYFGISEWLIEAGLKGETTAADALIKTFFTAISTGSGLIGGEVTPMFCAGTALGGAVAAALAGAAAGGGVYFELCGGVGMITAFGGLMRTPLAGIALGIERFGGDCAVYYVAAVCVGVILPEKLLKYTKDKLQRTTVRA